MTLKYPLSALLISSALLVGCSPGSPDAPEDTVTPEAPAAPAEPAEPQADTDNAVDALEEAGAGRLEAHEHGHANLVAAMDGDMLTVTFESPLMSVIGFEHEPETEKQVAAMEALQDSLSETANFVTLNSQAGCLPSQTETATRMTGDHGELRVEHVFQCSSPERLKQVDLVMLAQYPDIKTVDAVFVSDTQQAAAELTGATTALNID
ncbi:ZrgA family zinc uptake protein [Henriciella litoralis]|uniref:ZrgA family zinc uptake protein n=1 Tax=Henriciella litoralis TaxID=568102 RepID=UPI000A053889|nr:DUF2796 domain-containing protein [Henriciella litoralis]